MVRQITSVGAVAIVATWGLGYMLPDGYGATHYASATTQRFPLRPNAKHIVAFSSEEGIDPDGEVYREVVMFPGDSVTYKCASRELKDTGEIEIYPSDPQEFTLFYDSNQSVEDNVKVPISQHVLYRSDNKIVKKILMASKVHTLLIDYPKDAVVTAKDPDNFTLNFACRYTPNDTGKSIYRWLRVIIKDAYPMAYGCDSGEDHLFKTSLTLDPSKVKRLELTNGCKIYPTPGMIIGIYCTKGEKLYPEYCLTRLVNDKEGVTVGFDTNNSDPTFDRQSRSDKLVLFRVPASGIPKDAYFSCECKNASGEVTKKLEVSRNDTETVDVSKMFTFGKTVWPPLRRKSVHAMYPGKVIKFIIPSDFYKTLDDGSEAYVVLEPEDPQKNALVKDLENDTDILVPLDDFIGAKGFIVEKEEKNGTIQYTYKLDDEAIVVLKKGYHTNTACLWRMYHIGAHQHRRMYDVELHIGFTPTDPYTYGCGVDSRGLFRTDLTVITDTPEKDNKTLTTCTVSPHVVSPIGFYCPKGYTLEPPDCFNHMVLESTEDVVPLSNYLPWARATNGKHVRALDTGLPMSQLHRIKHTDDFLSCSCLDQEGVARATIRLDLSERTPSSVELVYGTPVKDA